jgi:hypothetical protein
MNLVFFAETREGYIAGRGNVDLVRIINAAPFAPLLTAVILTIAREHVRGAYRTIRAAQGMREFR